MKKLLAVALSFLFVSSTGVLAQNAASSTTGAKTASAKRRGPIFRATKDQINQAQAILKSRGLYDGEQTGKLDAATRDGLKKYQAGESLKETGTLNKLTLEKMGIVLTDKQKTL